MAVHMKAMRANTGYESGRPTKKDRRDIEKIKGRRDIEKIKGRRD